ncbi:hypothetical protein ABG768_028079 [Culter alburnus]|uniref:Uncharacterized protein n=1 Tax=Culter alburnus TaxID=194366 RepID=A0AAW2AA37_CULAL
MAETNKVNSEPRLNPAQGFPLPNVRLRSTHVISALIKTATSPQPSSATARLAQSVEHETLNLRVVGSSPTLGVSIASVSLPSGFSGSSVQSGAILAGQPPVSVAQSVSAFGC